jgi:hypothetical protein
MKKIILATALLMGAYLCNAQSIQDNLDRIQGELEKITVAARSLPAYQRNAIMASVESIRQLTGSTGNAPRHDYHNNNNNNRPQERVLSDLELANFLSSLKQTNFYDDKRVLVKRVARNTSFYMDQIHAILKTFVFNSERDEVRDILLPKAIDPENIRLLYDIYPFSMDQKRLNEILDQQPTPIR